MIRFFFDASSRRSILFRRFVKNRTAVTGSVIVVVFFMTGILAPFLAPYSPEAIDLANAFHKPSSGHWAGTDNLGRDILSRILYGARISITTGLLAVVIALVIGIPIGLVAGHWSGRTDMFLMRLMDVLLSFPGILLAIAIIVILGPGLWNAIIAVGIASVPLFARLVRGQCLQIRELEFVEAARAIGEGHVNMMLRYLFPNCLPAVVVQATLRVATAVIVASGLSFLGLGAQPPTPEWGAMLSEGREFIRTAPYLTIFPGLALMLFVLGFNLCADGLIDVLNPRIRSER